MSDTVAEDGVICAPVALGVELPMVREAVFAVPVSSPSYGVTVHEMVSPAPNPADSVVAVLTAFPFTVQTTVDWSESLSSSENPLQLQINVSVMDGLDGEIETVDIVGKELEMVMELERTVVPSSVPSLGVAMH